jgi:hypothetical protein
MLCNTKSHPSSGILNNYKTLFRELGLVPSTGEERETPTLVHWQGLALSKSLNIVIVSLHSPEDGNRSSFRNVLFSSI